MDLIDTSQNNQGRNNLVKSSSDLLQVREYAQDRFLHDFISKVKQSCTLSKNYIILVLDDYTARLFQKLKIKQIDMINQKIYQIERLNKKRKRYPMTDAIYFVAPSPESIQMIIEDFPEEDTIPYDQYGAIHIGFCSPCEKGALQNIARSPKLTKFIQTLVDVNIDYKVYEDNIFLQGPGRPGIDSLNYEAQQIVSVCASMSEFPFIQFSGNSRKCRDLAKQIVKDLDGIYMSGVNKEDASARPTVQFKKSKALLLILDRDFDLSQMLSHHPSYWSQLYDQLDGPQTKFETKETRRDKKQQR